MVTIYLPGRVPVEVWYPANGKVGVGSQTYDLRDDLPAAFKLELGAQHLYVATDANRNVLVGAPSEVFPLVVLSHGTAGYRDQTTFLTTRLASWGMIVAVPEVSTRDLAHVLTSGVPVAAPTSAEIVATISLFERENARKNGPFENRVDMTRVAVIGLDRGVADARAAAADPRVDAYVALGPEATTAPLPKKPSLFVAGTDDKVTPVAAANGQFERAPVPAYEWQIHGAGHNTFSDFCAVAQPQGGLVKVLDSVGAGAALTNPLVAQLTDGCAPPALAVTKTWPLVDRVVTGFLKHFIGPDPAPVGVGPVGVHTVAGVTVTISERLK